MNILRFREKTESHIRIWLKAITWRLLGTLTTFGTTFIITKDFNIATTVGSIEVVSKLILFYLHERLWIKINKIIDY